MGEYIDFIVIDGHIVGEGKRVFLPDQKTPRTRRDQEKKETKPAVAQPKQNTSRQ